MTMILKLAAASAALLTGSAIAQTEALRLSDGSVQAILSGCHAFAEENDITVAIAVLDDRLTLSGYRRMDGLRQGPAELAMAKADYSARWGSETKGLSDAVGEGRYGWAFATGSPPVEGGVPIYSEGGTLLGAVGVSGASAADDARCAKVGIEQAGLSAQRPER
jgi:glc operon protein GlcG